MRKQHCGIHIDVVVAAKENGGNWCSCCLINKQGIDLVGLPYLSWTNTDTDRCSGRDVLTIRHLCSAASYEFLRVVYFLYMEFHRVKPRKVTFIA